MSDKPKTFNKQVAGMRFTGPTAEALRESVNKQIKEGIEFQGEFVPKAILRKKSGEVRELSPGKVTRAMEGSGW